VIVTVGPLVSAADVLLPDEHAAGTNRTDADADIASVRDQLLIFFSPPS